MTDALHELVAATTTLVDLEKAFESVHLSKAWGNGRRLGFPMRILRMALEVSCFRRHLSFKGCVQEQGHLTSTAILAGTAYAADVLYLLIVPVCDSLLVSYPSLRISAVVDDITLQHVGERSCVGALTREATHDAITLLERECGAKVSRGQAWCPAGSAPG